METTFYDRLLIESKELMKKIVKLKQFTLSERFETVEPIQQSLLKVQLTAMNTYSECLQQRIVLLNKPTEKCTECFNTGYNVVEGKKCSQGCIIPGHCKSEQLVQTE